MTYEPVDRAAVAAMEQWLGAASPAIERWFDEAPRRASEGDGTIYVTRLELDELRAIAGHRIDTLLGWPVRLAKPYDRAAE